MKLVVELPEGALENLFAEFSDRFFDRLKKETEQAQQTALKENALPMLMTRQEVARLLGISLVTLNAWSASTADRNAILSPKRIGRQVRYDRAEVLKACKTVQKFKRTK